MQLLEKNFCLVIVDAIKQGPILYVTNLAQNCKRQGKRVYRQLICP